MDKRFIFWSAFAASSILSLRLLQVMPEFERINLLKGTVGYYEKTKRAGVALFHVWPRNTASLINSNISSKIQTEFYASPEGRAAGAGTIEDPWDLKTALSQPEKVKPGTKIWLREGTYKGRFISNLTGTAKEPIIVRAMAGERVILDGNVGAETNYDAVLDAFGAHAWYWGFEVTNSNPNRWSDVSYLPPEGMAHGIDANGPGLKFINLIIHDNIQGISAPARGAADFEAYGNIIFNNGYQSPDGPRGSGIVTQNTEAGEKSYGANLIFNNFQKGILLGGLSTTSTLNHLFSKNIFFNSQLAFPGPGISNLVLRENYSYNSTLALGGKPPQPADPFDNGNASLEKNYLMAGVKIFNFKNVSSTGNVVWNIAKNKNAYIYENNSWKPSNFSFEQNLYYTAGMDARQFQLAKSVSSFAGDYEFGKKGKASKERKYWQNTLGYDKSGAFIKDVPHGVKVAVLPNAYEKDRAALAVFNWDRLPTIQADVSELDWKTGDAYEIRNALDYFGDVQAGTYDGSGTVPVSMGLASRSLALPLGYPQPLGLNTFPEFGAFALSRKIEKAASASSDIRETSTVPVQISGISVTTMPSAAAVYWRTNIPAASLVEFGKTASSFQISKDRAEVLDHGILISDLSASTAYFFKITSASATTTVMTFKTASSFAETTSTLYLTTQISVSPQATSAVVTWTTNNPSTAELEVRSPSKDSKLIKSDFLAMRHSIVLEDLLPGTKYDYRIAGSDGANNSIASLLKSFTTVNAPAKKEDSRDNSFTSLKLIWQSQAIKNLEEKILQLKTPVR